MRALCGAVGVLAVLVGGAAGQEAVTFKPYAHKAGDKTRTTKTEATTGTTAATFQGQAHKKDETKKKTLVYVTEVLEVGPDATKPAKLRRTYEKAVEERDGDEKPLSLHGKTVLVERAGEKYAYTTGGAAVDAAAAQELDREFAKKGSLGDSLFPATGVKPGESWDLTEKFIKDMSTPDNPLVIAPKGAVVTGKLLSTSTKGGTTFGDIQVTADLPLAEIRGKYQLDPGSSWKISMTGTGALDGTSPEGNSAATTTIAIDGGAMGVTLKIDTVVKTTSRTVRVGGAK